MSYKNKLNTHTFTNYPSKHQNISEKDIQFAQRLAKKIISSSTIVSLTVGEDNVFAIKQLPYDEGNVINLYTIHIEPRLIPLVAVKANSVDIYLPSCKIRVVIKEGQ